MFLGGVCAADVCIHAKAATRKIQVKSLLHCPKQNQKWLQVNPPIIYFKTYRIQSRDKRAQGYCEEEE